MMRHAKIGQREQQLEALYQVCMNMHAAAVARCHSLRLVLGFRHVVSRFFIANV